MSLNSPPKAAFKKQTNKQKLLMLLAWLYGFNVLGNDKAMAHVTVDELKHAQASSNTSNVTGKLRVEWKPTAFSTLFMFSFLLHLPRGYRWKLARR